MLKFGVLELTFLKLMNVSRLVWDPTAYAGFVLFVVSSGIRQCFL
jgi:hypothetical protein